MYNKSPFMADAPQVESLGGEAYLRIREMALSGALVEGTFISEAELVRLLGMSRTPVREGLHKAQAENYLTYVPGHGYTVPKLSVSDLYNLYAVRAVLEGLAAEHAALRIDRVGLATLEDLVDEMSAAITSGDDETFTRANNDYHATIADASGNAYLRSTLAALYENSERFRLTILARPVRPDEAQTEHRQIIDALRARDAAQAKDLAIRHVDLALDLRRQLIEQSSSDISVPATKKAQQN